MRGQALGTTRETEAVGRRRSNGDLRRVDPQRSRKPCAHRGSHRRDVWLLADEDAIGVNELEAGFLHDLVRAL